MNSYLIAELINLCKKLSIRISGNTEVFIDILMSTLLIIFYEQKRKDWKSD